MVDPKLLDILVCPVCKSKVSLRDGRIACSGCGRLYPIRDGIPVMLSGEAEMPGEDGRAERR